MEVTSAPPASAALASDPQQPRTSRTARSQRRARHPEAARFSSLGMIGRVVQELETLSFTETSSRFQTSPFEIEAVERRDLRGWRGANIGRVEDPREPSPRSSDRVEVKANGQGSTAACARSLSFLTPFLQGEARILINGKSETSTRFQFPKNPRFR